MLLKTVLVAELRSISSIEYEDDPDGPRYLDMPNSFSDDETVNVLVTGPDWEFSPIEGDDQSTHFVDIFLTLKMTRQRRHSRFRRAS